MKRFFLLGLGVTLISAFAGMVSSSSKQRSVVLAKKTEVTPIATQNPTPLPTIIPTPTATPTITSQPTATPTRIPTPKPASSEVINGYIESFSGQYATDPNVLRHIAICESGFNPNAVNGPYVGLFQFGPITWMNTRKMIGEDPNVNLRYDAKAAVQTAAYLLASRGRGFWPNCKP